MELRTDCPRSLTIDGETRTVAQWARISGVNYNTLYYRLRKGHEARVAVFGERYSTDLRREGGARPGYFGRRKKATPRTPVRFEVGPLPQWGSVQSITFRRCA